jgi:hypothetical protein
MVLNVLEERCVGSNLGYRLNFLKDCCLPFIPPLVIFFGPSLTEPPEVMEIHSDWSTPFMIYFRTGGLPEDKFGHERLHHLAGLYTLVNDELFR